MAVARCSWAMETWIVPDGPVFLIGVDTEADDQWTVEGRRRLGVRNAACLPRFQALCDRYGVRPSYLVTHEMAFAREVSDRVAFFKAGKIHEIGPPEQIFGSPQAPETAAFLASVL